MRVAQIMLVSLLFIGCYKPESKITGKWYAPNFGVITASDNFIEFFGSSPYLVDFQIKSSEFEIDHKDEIVWVPIASGNSLYFLNL